MRDGTNVESPPAVVRVRDELGAEFRRVAHVRPEAQERHPPVRIVGALAAAAAVMIIVGVLLFGSDNSLPGTEGALAVSSHGTSFTVRVVDASASPERMTEELQAAGVDGQVLSIPVTPSHVNEWVQVSGPAGTAGLLRQLQIHPEFLRIPADAEQVVLIAGRPATEGEVPNVLPDGGTLPERVK